ncbi:hypothetical protein pipiens_013915 [Culex pipiens pipiens]|uniref:TIL domain-containing protein n=1 Tax=Culex pipiens pipiens TaxID=38569 RepID=A0ABD1CWR9_CULPP
MELQVTLIVCLSALMIEVSSETQAILSCGPNEYIVPFLPMCESTCYRTCAPIQSQIARPTCICNPTFVRYNGQCIPATACPQVQPPVGGPSGGASNGPYQRVASLWEESSECRPTWE